MYACERLARGTSGGFIKCGRVQRNQTVNVISDTLADKRSYFGHANMFSVAKEKDPERPVGKLYVSRCSK